jgi:hypothetical protein
MGFEYSPQAIDYCKKLWLRCHGRNTKWIEEQMHKAGWTGWRAKNLWGDDGWIAKYGFREALLDYLKQQTSPTLDSAQELVRDISEVRRGLMAEVRVKGTASVDKERLQLLRDFSNLEITGLTKVEAARDTLSAWVAFWEKQLEWVMDIDPKLSRLLLKHSEAIIARAEQEFGEEMPGGELSAKSEGPSADSADDADSKSNAG